MNLEQQLQILIDEAPQYGVPSVVMQKAVAPVLKLFAKRLQHGQYYILQTPHQDWILTTLTHRKKPKQEKKVIYAFVSAQDAQNFQETANSEISLLLLPVTHLLFQVFCLESVDSIIFLETPGNSNQGTEIERAKLKKMIEQHLSQFTSPSQASPTEIPPHIA
jgi:hypothetical protein